MASPHFDISAAVVRQLGEELVSDEVTAIVELVKNAYDADATYAHVVVNTTDVPQGMESKFPKASGYVTIDDDGMGMDRSDIERGWLMISLSGKRVMKAAGHTTPKGRTPLGDKGLGRLSTQKLGQNLELYTRKDGQAETLHVAFAWDAFTDDKSLSEVPVSIEPTDKSARNKGTMLVISGLRNAEVWRGSAVEKLIADLSQVISPFAEARPFLVTLRIDGRPIDLGQVSAKVRGAAVAKFTIDFDGAVMTLAGKFRLVKLRGNQDVDSYEQLLARDNGRAFFEYLKARKASVGFRLSNDPNYFLEFDYRLQLSALSDAPDPALSLPSRSWQNRDVELRKQFRKVTQQIEDARKAHNDTVAALLATAITPRAAPRKAFAKYGAYEGGGYSYPIRRCGRIRDPLAASLLTAYSRFLAREAYEHDFSKAE